MDTTSKLVLAALTDPTVVAAVTARLTADLGQANDELARRLRVAEAALAAAVAHETAGVNYLLDHANQQLEVGAWWASAIRRAFGAVDPGKLAEQEARAQAARDRRVSAETLHLFAVACELEGNHASTAVAKAAAHAFALRARDTAQEYLDGIGS